MNITELLSGPGKPGVLSSEVWLAAYVLWMLSEGGLEQWEAPWAALIVAGVLGQRLIAKRPGAAPEAAEGEADTEEAEPQKDPASRHSGTPQAPYPPVSRP